jgi:sugar/nucleoside kinase (ribokinase family)
VTALWSRWRPDRRFDVFGLGQCALDQVAVVAAYPRCGEKRRIERWLELPGGQVATAVLACARLGLRTALATSVGADAGAERVLEPLRAAGVDLSAVRRVAGARTQGAMIVVDRSSGERTVLWHRDEALALAAGHVPALLADSAVVHLDAGDLEASIEAARRARSLGLPVVLDADTPAPGVEALLATVDFPIVSREFAKEAYGGPREALRALRALGARLAVVTLGREGALASGDEGELASPAFACDAVDTTGAGDAFHGAFAWALLQGCGAERALRLSNAVAALNCAALGAQGGLPTRAELSAYLARQGEPPL